MLPRTSYAATTLPAACLALLASCSSGLGSESSAPTPTPSAPSGTGIGLDFGFGDDGAGGERTLTQPIADDYSLAGILIPAIDGEVDRRLSLMAFSTAAPAADADGAGSSLVTSGGASADANAASDVFLLALDDGLVPALDGSSQPAAFSRTLMSVFQHSRCVHCHGIRDTTSDIFPNAGSGSASDEHPGGDVGVMNSIPDDPSTPGVNESNITCTACHDSTLASSGALGIDWFAPVTDEFALDFRGLSARALSERVEEINLDQHLLVDSRVRWAIDVGLVPGGVNDPILAGSSARWVTGGVRVSEVGPVPVSMDEFEGLLRTWETEGHQPTAASSVQSVVLVSRTGAGDAGNGASSDPSVAWVPNAAYNPAGGGIQTAGTAFVAFASEASDLVGGGTVTSDVYRTGFLVRVDLGAPGAPVAFDPLNDTVLVSSSSGGAAANGASMAPSISGSGTRIAFASEASDLIAGFVDGNGVEADVYVRDVSTGGTVEPTVLVSHAFGNLVEGGSAAVLGGGSGETSLSSDGEYLAFSSTADDLVLDDSNDQRDVFVADLGDNVAITAASVSAGGTPASGGSSLAPSVASVNGEANVVFESNAPNLDPAIPSTGRQIFLRENGQTRLLSRSVAGTTGGNGASTAPSLSPSGREAVFTSSATNLGRASDPDTNGATDSFLVNLTRLRNGASFDSRRLNVNAFGSQSTSAGTGVRIAGLKRDDTSPGGATFVALRSTDPKLGFTAEPLVGYFLAEEDPPLQADFAINGAASMAEDQITIQFEDLSTGDPTSYLWNFGDNPSNPGTPIGTSTDADPSFAFTQVGTYEVSLTVSRGDNSNTETKSDFVTVLVPLAVESVSPTSANVEEGDSIAFSSTLSRSDGVTYRWVFGNGDESAAAMPNYAYPADGSFMARLEVSDAFGMDTSAMIPVTVVEPTGAGFTFNSSTDGLRYNSFQDTSVGAPTAIAWDFEFTGDSGNPAATFVTDTTGAAGGTVSHDFPSTGLFRVALRASYAAAPDSYNVQFVNVDAVTFAEVIGGLQSACGSCHGGGSPSDGLTFSGSLLGVYNNLIDVNVSASGCAASGSERVEPYSLSDSFLWGIANADPAVCGMSRVTSSADRDDISDWILQGAAFD